MLRKPAELLLLAVLICCFCAGGNHLRRKSPELTGKYLAEHPDLPATDKSCIENGRLEVGMQQGTVLFMLGEPARKETVKQSWGTQELWYYVTDGNKVFTIEHGIVVGIGESPK